MLKQKKYKDEIDIIYKWSLFVDKFEHVQRADHELEYGLHSTLTTP